VKASNAVLAVAAAAAISVPSVGLAQGMSGPDSTWYIGATIGQSTADDACTGVSGPGVSCDDTDTAWRILAGYRVNRHFALEAGYHQLGEVSASGPGGRVTIEPKALEFLAVGILPVAAKFSVYGKAGLYRGETEASGNSILFGAISESESNTDLTFGVGLQFDFTHNLGVRAEWQRYQDMGGGRIGEADVDAMSIGLIYRFK
jgi:OOP family OmpA-OmpF porin